MFSVIFGSQWFVKALLIFALLFVGYFILKPVKSAQHLAMRRLGMMLFIAFATLAVLFPSALTRIAYWLNIGRGTDLLLYAVVLFFFSSVVTAYRRDASNEKKLTELARTLALNNVQHQHSDTNEVPGSSKPSPAGVSTAPTTKADAADDLGATAGQEPSQTRPSVVGQATADSE